MNIDDQVSNAVDFGIDQLALKVAEKFMQIHKDEVAEFLPLFYDGWPVTWSSQYEEYLTEKFGEAIYGAITSEQIQNPEDWITSKAEQDYERRHAPS